MNNTTKVKMLIEVELTINDVESPKEQLNELCVHSNSNNQITIHGAVSLMDNPIVITKVDYQPKNITFLNEKTNKWSKLLQCFR